MEVQTWTSPGKASDQPDHKHDDDVVTENRWEIILVACHVAQITGLAQGIFFLNQFCEPPKILVSQRVILAHTVPHMTNFISHIALKISIG